MKSRFFPKEDNNLKLEEKNCLYRIIQLGSMISILGYISHWNSFTFLVFLRDIIRDSLLQNWRSKTVSICNLRHQVHWSENKEITFPVSQLFIALFVQLKQTY